MTSESITFLWAEVENFRGFRDRQRIELDASVVILYGPNGTGKTSLFDALQWLLLGKLERLEPWRVRRNVEHITNAWRVGFANSGGLVFVDESAEEVAAK